jgi:hypothetical protein
MGGMGIVRERILFILFICPNLTGLFSERKKAYRKGAGASLSPATGLVQPLAYLLAPLAARQGQQLPQRRSLRSNTPFFVRRRHLFVSIGNVRLVIVKRGRIDANPASLWTKTYVRLSAALGGRKM